MSSQPFPASWIILHHLGETAAAPEALHTHNTTQTTPTIPPDYQLMQCPIACMYPCHHHQLTRHSCIRVQTHQTHHQDTRFICTRHLPAPWWYHPPGAVCGSPASRGKVMSRKTNKLQAPVLEYFIYSRHPYL